MTRQEAIALYFANHPAPDIERLMLWDPEKTTVENAKLLGLSISITRNFKITYGLKCADSYPGQGTSKHIGEIVELINRGVSSEEVARRMGCSPSTIRNILSECCEKVDDEEAGND